jgi:hypothetical protein
MTNPSTQPIAAPITRPRRLILRALATLLLIIGLGLIFGFAANRLPFHQTTGATTVTIVARHTTRLPPNLHQGDIIPFAAQSATTRAVLAFPNVPRAIAYPLHIIRQGKPLAVTLHSSRIPSAGQLADLISNFIIAITALFALVTLWRGTDWIAWGLSIFAFAIMLDGACNSLPLPAPYNIATGTILIFASSGLPIAGLYISAINLIAPPPPLRRRLDRVFSALIIIITALELALPLGLIALANQGPAYLPAIILTLVAITVLIPVSLLILGYLHADQTQKLRIRWFMVGTSLILVVFAIGVTQSLDLVANPALRAALRVAPALVTLLIFASLAYAATTQRLIDVRIVISRAMLVTALISIIVASLGVSERLIVSSALGSNASHALELAVALGVGILFHQAQRWIEAAIDRLFFWREHQARAQLRDFVRDAGFIESTDILTTRTVTALAQRLDAPGAALYEWRGDLIERTAQTGTQPYPPTLDPDDPALVRLRATRAPLDLHGLNSNLDTDGMALPLALRGRLFGIIACRPRTAGKYAPSEMDELGRAAHDTGAALFALRARANETLIEQLATNRITPNQAITEARTLTGL